VGLAQPYLAILSIIGFAVAVTAITFTYLYVIDSLNKAPVLGVYAEALIDYYAGVVNLTIAIKHERGRPVEIHRLLFRTEKGELVVEREDLNQGYKQLADGSVLLITKIGLKNSSIPTGSTARLTLSAPLDLFLEGETYSGVLFFNEGTYPISFTPVPLTLLKPAGLYPLELHEPHYVEACKSLELLERITPLPNVTESFENGVLPAGWSYVGNWSVTSISNNGLLMGSNTGNEGLIGVSVSYYNADTGVETTLASTRVKLVSGASGRWGLAFYYEHRGKEKIVSISLNTTGYFELVSYSRVGKRIEVEILNSSRVLTGVSSSWFTILAMKECSGQECNITSYLYDESYSLVTVVSAPVLFEGLGGVHKLYIGVFVDDASAVFDDFVLISGVQIPPGPSYYSQVITVLNVPSGYFVELRDSNGFTVDSGVSTGGNVTLRATLLALGTGSSIVVRYPNNLECYRYIALGYIYPGDVYYLGTTSITVEILSGGRAANVSSEIALSSYYTLPSGRVVYNASGFSLVSLANNDVVAYNITVRARAADYGDLYAWIYLVNTTTTSVQVEISGGDVTNLQDPLVLGPGEHALVYVHGFTRRSEYEAEVPLLIEACTLVFSDLNYEYSCVCLKYPVKLALRN